MTTETGFGFSNFQETETGKPDSYRKAETIKY